jgi:2-hydroxychromene-2-carboxylate isomerase
MSQPFKVVAVRAMRDIERRAAMYGLKAAVPAPYPLKEFDLANRVAIVAAAEGWCPAYLRATYRRWLEEGKEAGSEPNLSESLAEAGRDPAEVVPLAASDAVGKAYEAATAEARGLGVFGSPTFVVNGELFWGDDRLEDAVAWRRNGRLG